MDTDTQTSPSPAVRQRRPFLPILWLFIGCNALLLLGRDRLAQWGADTTVLLLGNLLLFVVTALAYWLARRGMHSHNPYAFVRAVYGSLMVKFFLVLLAVLAYGLTARGHLNKLAIFGCILLYLLYTLLEVAALVKRPKS
ncbi:MAG TPA: hypothetical protein VG870_01275 [Chitinophagaceae bacterium]|nr:hypothetical protein [Chitinophagaceae bacterium]